MGGREPRRSFADVRRDAAELREKNLGSCEIRAVCASVCVWNVLSVCVMRLVCRPGVSMKILKRLLYQTYQKKRARPLVVRR